jgi:CheY-like chemotaxis protein
MRAGALSGFPRLPLAGPRTIGFGAPRAMSPSPRRVLVVDDEPQVAAMLRDIVSMLGYAVRVADTGSEALRVVPVFQPDVVLLDVALPEIPGDVVLARLRAAHPELPVVMITGNTDPDLAHQTLARGAFDYVAKPFNLARLAQVLEAALAFRE